MMNIWKAVAGLWIVSSCIACAADAPRLATAIGKADGCPGGLQVVLGPAQVDLAMEMAKTGVFDTQILVSKSEDVQKERAALIKRQASGQVSVFHDGTSYSVLPYADNLLNRIVFPNWRSAVNPAATAREIARVTAPGGMIYADAAAAAQLIRAGLWAKGNVGSLASFTKPWPADIDEWTHHAHGADGNAVARDRKVGPPRHYQWLAEPRWMRTHESESSISAIVTGAGRIYSIMDEAPPGLFGPKGGSGDWYLVAQDAFNGQYLWKVPISEWGWEYWQTNWFMGRPGDLPLNLQKRLVAQGNQVYATLGYRAPITELDGRTGTVLKTFAGTAGTNEIIVQDDLLIAAVLNVSQGGKYAHSPRRTESRHRRQGKSVRPEHGKSALGNGQVLQRCEVELRHQERQDAAT